MRRLACVALLGVVVTACGSGGSSTVSEPREGVAPAPPVAASADRGPGPTAVEGIVPVGFTRSPDGAVAAATTYLSTLHQLVASPDGDRRAALGVLSADGADALVDNAMAAFDTLDGVVADARRSAPDARLFLREVPVAYSLDQYTDDRARIEVWSLGLLLIEGVTQATEVWSTNEVELVWDGDDWRVWSWARTPGPQPAVGSVAPTPASEVLDAVEAWEGFRYVPDAS